MRFVQERLYHIYNRGNNQQRIFLDEDNYSFFLEKFSKEMGNYCELLSYCLMPNHYHFLVFVKYNKSDLSDVEYSDRVSRKLGTLQSSYTQAINKRHDRSGSLFQQKSKSKELGDNARTCFHYIHQNPLKASLVDRMEDWEFSSFKDYTTKQNQQAVNRQLAYELLDISSDPEAFYQESLAVIVDEKIVLFY